MVYLPTHPMSFASAGFTIHFRWLFWTLGALCVVLGVSAPLLENQTLPRIKKRLALLAEAHFALSLGLLAFLFFVFAGLDKFSQLYTLRLNSLDFWLFEDLLRNSLHGGFLLSRFAPQAQGIVQHGAVHSTWSYLLAMPLAWVIGPTACALLYGPICLSGAAIFLGLLARPRWTPVSALFLALAFLCSTQVGHLLNYDVHPEVAYPLAVFAWAWALGLGDGRVRIFSLLMITLFGMGIKEDSFLVFFPWAFWAIFSLKNEQRKAALASGLFALMGTGFAMLSIGRFASGAWSPTLSNGPALWEGLAVHIPRGADLIQGIHWNSPQAALLVWDALTQKVGGVQGVFSHFLHFWGSRPWLSILILVPWVLRDLRFYFLVFPLTLAYSLLERAAYLNLYYAAPVLGTVWAAAVISKKIRYRELTATLCLLATWTLGNGSIEIHWPSAQALAIHKKVAELTPCLPPGRGMVQTTLLDFIPREKVFSFAPPHQDSPVLSFQIMTPAHPSYELNPKPLIKKLENSPLWTEIGAHCQPGNWPEQAVRLWIRREGLLGRERLQGA